MGIWVEPSVHSDTNALLAALRTRPAFAALEDRCLRFTSLADVDIQLAEWQRRLERAARMLQPRTAIAILIQAISSCYYGAPQLRFPEIGPALKISLASVWPIQWEENGGSLNGTDYIELISISFIVGQLHMLRMAFYQAEQGEVTLSADALQTSGPVGELLAAFNFAFARRGQMLRLAQETTTKIITDAPNVLSGILRILRGDKGEIEELRDCWLSKVPRKEPRIFWERLAVLLTLFLELSIMSEDAGVPAEAALMLPNFAFVMKAKLGKFNPSVHSRGLFWQRDWLAKQHPREHRNLIVERPIVRVSQDPPVYCSALGLVGDAINWFVESSIISYHGASGVRLSQACFRSLLSEPFERQVEAEMRALGLRAGTVTEKGCWQLERPVELAPLAGEPPPGEIDVLAVHDSGFIFVLECKVLAMPTTDERLRNLMGKLGGDDTEAMHSKVGAKLTWVRRISSRLVSAVVEERAIIVLDRPWPGVALQASVLDLEMLHTFIQKAITARPAPCP